MSAYHRGARELQDRFDTRRLADSLAEKLSRTAFTAEDKAFVEARSMFFLATADADLQPDVSYKGGVPGFVRVTEPLRNNRAGDDPGPSGRGRPDESRLRRRS